jgi:hypothetical protein
MRHTTLTFITAVCLTAAASACGGSHAPSSAQAPSTVDARTGSTTRTTLATSPTTERTTTTRPSGGGTTTTTATTPTTTSPPPSTSSAIDPTRVPAVVTPSYVDAVFVVLNHIYGNALRLDLQTVDVPPQSVADLRSIYNDPLFGQEVTIASQTLTGNLSNVRMPPGDQVTRVTRLISSSPSCIFIEATTTVRQVVFKTPPVGYEYFELQPKQAGIDPQNLNSTPWAISFNVFYSSPTPQADPCTAS